MASSGQWAPPGWKVSSDQSGSKPDGQYYIEYADPSGTFNRGHLGCSARSHISGRTDPWLSDCAVAADAPKQAAEVHANLQYVAPVQSAPPAQFCTQERCYDANDTAVYERRKADLQRSLGWYNVPGAGDDNRYDIVAKAAWCPAGWKPTGQYDVANGGPVCEHIQGNINAPNGCSAQHTAFQSWKDNHCSGVDNNLNQSAHNQIVAQQPTPNSNKASCAKQPSSLGVCPDNWHYVNGGCAPTSSGQFDTSRYDALDIRKDVTCSSGACWDSNGTIVNSGIRIQGFNPVTSVVPTRNGVLDFSGLSDSRKQQWAENNNSTWNNRWSKEDLLAAPDHRAPEDSEMKRYCKTGGDDGTINIAASCGNLNSNDPGPGSAKPMWPNQCI